jgi:cystathionine beta-lyase/cystathionine gamma-synthase
LKPEERAELGIGDALVRFSAGLESEADLLGDIERALINV